MLLYPRQFFDITMSLNLMQNFMNKKFMKTKRNIQYRKDQKISFVKLLK